MKLIHVSDLHFTVDAAELFCGNPRERFRACVDHINRNHLDAGLCVVTGDLTHWGESLAYQLLKGELRNLAIDTVLLLGNHDDRPTFRSLFPGQPVDDNGFVQSVREIDGARYVFMDTLEPGTHAGGYCERRLEWLEGVLGAGLNRPHYLFMHHQPMPVRIAAMDLIGQQDGAALREVLSAHAGDIRHMFFGHCHLPMSGAWRGIPFSSIRSVNHPLWPDYASPTITIADVAPHYAVALIEGDGLVIHHEEFLFNGRTWAGLGTAWEAWSPDAEHTGAAAE